MKRTSLEYSFLSSNLVAILCYAILYAVLLKSVTTYPPRQWSISSFPPEFLILEAVMVRNSNSPTQIQMWHPGHSMKTKTKQESNMGVDPRILNNKLKGKKSRRLARLKTRNSCFYSWSWLHNQL